MDAGPAHLIPSAGASRLQPAAAGPGSLQATPAGARMTSPLAATVPLVLHYQFCAYDSSVRMAWLDRRRGFFNGTSLCLRVHGQEDRPHTLQLLASDATASWQVATGLDAVDTDARGWGLYRAA